MSLVNTIVKGLIWVLFEFGFGSVRLQFETKHEMVWVISKSCDLESRDPTRVVFIGLSNFELES